MEARPKAVKAKDTEWGKLWDQKVPTQDDPALAARPSRSYRPLAGVSYKSKRKQSKQTAHKSQPTTQKRLRSRIGKIIENKKYKRQYVGNSSQKTTKACRTNHQRMHRKERS